ncbi:MAG TPA: YdcF family protein, partial [Anaerolineae bacterium]|nr:YdcF family protein [Anaerolineae bacterium]
MRRLVMILTVLSILSAALRRLALVYVPRAQRLRPVDVLVVLGHPANADGSPSPAMQETVALAVRLYRVS